MSLAFHYEIYKRDIRMHNNYNFMEDGNMAKNYVVDRKILNRMTWKSTFAQYISKLVEYPMSKENIYSDEYGSDYFVTSYSLTSDHPLLLVNPAGTLISIIPYKDYEQLEMGRIYPLTYIINAKWNYGKCSGGNDVRSGIFWKPLERHAGICNTDRASKFLNKMKVDGICDDDYRQKLFDATEKRIREELKLEVSSFMSYEGENALLIADPQKRNSVICYLPAILLNYILYYPEEREWDEFAECFTFELGVLHSRRRYVISNKTKENHAEFCRKVWRTLGMANSWQTTESDESHAQHHNHHKNKSTFGSRKRKDFFRRGR